MKSLYKYKIIKIIVPALIFIFISLAGFGQQTNQDTSTTDEIIIYNSDNTILKKDTGDFIKYLNGNVKIYHDSTFFFADTAVLNQKILTAWGNIVIMQHDTIKIFSDSLYYNGDSLKAKLKGRVLLQNENKEVRTNNLYYDVHNKIAKYTSGAELTQKSSVLKSQTGTYFVNQNIIKFKDFVSVRDSSFNLFTDSLDFDTKSRIARFIAPTLINRDSSNIYCESGYYDLENNNALFEKNMTYKKNDVSATAKKLFYIDSLSRYILAGNAIYKEKDLVAKADTIYHNTKKDQSVLLGNAEFKNKNQSAYGNKIIYNHKNESFVTEGRSTLTDKNIKITADHTDYSKKDGKGYASGKVIFVDTASNIIINSSKMFLQRDNNYMLAFGDSLKRVLMLFMEKTDTTYLSSDTLMSMDVIKQIDSLTFDTLNTLKAYNNVKIFNKDYQALSDSLAYFPDDSLYILYDNPVLWSDSTQIIGDTINIKTTKGGIDNIYTRKNAFITNFIQGELYNQITGQKINSFFEKDSLRSMDVFGNAEIIYHMTDDEGALTGTIKTTCSKIHFLFKNNKISTIDFFTDPKSDFTPIKKEIQNPQKLNGFQWLDAKRPKSKDEVRVLD